MHFINCLILSFLVGTIVAQTPPKFAAQYPCASRGTCQECIQIPTCAWCYDPQLKSSARCFQPSSTLGLKDEQCKEEFTFNPGNELEVSTNLQLFKLHSKLDEGNSTTLDDWTTDGASISGAGDPSGAQRIVQVAPQRVSLKLRARSSYNVIMSYTQAENYPLDLYYLMDLSRSMMDDKEILSQMGDLLADTMQKITSKFTLGFGSFVDKVVMPYVSTLPENLVHPCTDCGPPYGYRHHMSLGTETYTFSTLVKQANVSGNLDSPEGGFDAIMQAAVCRDRIGWRAQARRLLVFSTDASFHYAGDGKLGGIVKPNDGHCHMSREGYYSESSYQDYPSVEQLNIALKRNGINVIFAVTQNQMDLYEELAKHIEGASVAQLAKDSSNIVDLIKNQYEKISSSVQMRHNASSDVSLKFFTKCLNANGEVLNTNKCSGIKTGDIINFKIEIEVLKCPKEQKDRFQTIEIYPVGLRESLIIDLEMLCGCDCEKPGDKYYEENARACNFHGTYKGGICDCNPGAFGRHCECNGDTVSEFPSNVQCLPANSTTKFECSGRGTCICGRCECESRSPLEQIYGKFCECDNFSCEWHLGELCGGESHGTCDCGVCLCKPGWTGSDCSCEESNAHCNKPRVGADHLQF